MSYFGLYDDLPSSKTGASEDNSKPKPSIDPQRAKLFVPIRRPAPVDPHRRPRPPIATSSTLLATPQPSARTPNDASRLKPTEDSKGDAYQAAVSAAAINAVVAKLQVQDEYDPARPNQYDAYIKEKQRREKEEEALRKRQLELEALAASRAAADAARASNAPKIDLNISGDEAFLRRARLSQPQAKTSDATADAPKVKNDVAKNIMAKMGWREGSGLGKLQQGITAPLIARKTDRNSGVILNTSNKGLNAQPANPAEEEATAKRNQTAVASTVVLLTNMVAPGTVDEYLEGETAEECEKYGAVSTCVIFEVKDGTVPAEESVRIFVQFVSSESAMKALTALDGRYFAGRTVRARFFSEERFTARDLAPRSNE